MAECAAVKILRVCLVVIGVEESEAEGLVFKKRPTYYRQAFSFV